MNILYELAGGSNIATIENQIRHLSQVIDIFAARQMGVTVKATPSDRQLNRIEK